MQKSDIVHTERILKALANRRRLALLASLKKGNAINVSGLSHAIKLSFRATSRHLNVLEAAGIVTHSQQGLNMYYSLAQSIPDSARRIIDIL